MSSPASPATSNPGRGVLPRSSLKNRAGAGLAPPGVRFNTTPALSSSAGSSRDPRRGQGSIPASEPAVVPASATSVIQNAQEVTLSDGTVKAIGRCIGSHLVPHLKRLVKGLCVSPKRRGRRGSYSSVNTPTPGPEPTPPARPTKRRHFDFPPVDVFGPPPPQPPSVFPPLPPGPPPPDTATASRVYCCEICDSKSHDTGDCPYLRRLCLSCGDRSHTTDLCRYRNATCGDCLLTGHTASIHRLPPRDIAVLRTYGVPA